MAIFYIDGDNLTYFVDQDGPNVFVTVNGNMATFVPEPDYYGEDAILKLELIRENGNKIKLSNKAETDLVIQKLKQHPIIVSKIEPFIIN